jgi:hypothetical protein
VSDGARYVAMIAAFALAVTAHVTIVWGLAWQRPKWRAAAALLVLPLAPWWAWRARMHLRALAWAVGVVVYAATAFVR